MCHVCRISRFGPALAALVGQALALPAASGQEATIAYPATRREECVDAYHGVEVADPYRWLEADVRQSAETAAWVAAQNGAARGFLDAIEKRTAIRARLAELWDYERFSTPRRIPGGYLVLRNAGLQNQPVLYFAENYRDRGRVLIDPNAWSADGSAALGGMEASDDGSLVAFTRKDAGSDWSTIRVVRTSDGSELEDRLEWSRHGNIVFNAAGDGFYYTRYPAREADEKHQAPSLNPAIYFHRLGDPQTADALAYRRPDHPEWSFGLSRTEDDRYLVLAVYRSTDPQNQVWIRPASAPIDAPWRPLIEDFEHQFALVGNDGSRLFFLTDWDAPTKRIVTLDAERPGRDSAVAIVASQKATLEDASLVGGQLVCTYLEDVISRVRRYGLGGEPLGELPLPDAGTAEGFYGKQTDEETFFSFSSYVVPRSIYRCDLRSGSVELVRTPQLDFDAAQYESRPYFAASKDGTQVPVIVSHRRGLPRDGRRPVLLYGYGGFGISLTPAFRVDYAAWMELGGVLAVANLRGGGEYGKAWHEAAKQVRKQNSFDDFLAVAEWLIREQYTSPKRLAVMGGSNGGLLVGAVVAQRPELFGAALPAVGVMDMLRYNRFTAGHFWRDEYGTSDDPEMFRALRAYSPYHNLRPGVAYPATLVTTADTDDRVVPMHSFKFAAALQHAQAGDAPALLRVETRAGHGSGTPTAKLIDLAADHWAFLWKTLGMEEER